MGQCYEWVLVVGGGGEGKGGKGNGTGLRMGIGCRFIMQPGGCPRVIAAVVWCGSIQKQYCRASERRLWFLLFSDVVRAAVVRRLTWSGF